VALALLVAVSAGVVFTALAGARRAAHLHLADVLRAE
jgi:hypothetical protein